MQVQHGLAQNGFLSPATGRLSEYVEEVTDQTQATALAIAETTLDRSATVAA